MSIYLTIIKVVRLISRVVCKPFDSENTMTCKRYFTRTKTFPNSLLTQFRFSCLKMKFANTNNNVKIVKPKNEEIQTSTFHQAVGPCLVYGQFFGMLPVDGVLSENESELEFRWKSLKTIYSMAFLFCGTVESCLGTRRLLRLGFNIRYVEGLVFFILAVVRGFIFFRLARKWTEIMKMWKRCEDVFVRDPYKVEGASLKVKVRVVFTVLVTFAMGKWLMKLLEIDGDQRVLWN